MEVCMSVIFAVLKFIGILLLVLIGIAVFICAAVVFVPVRYAAKITTEDSLQYGFSASWLLHAVSLRKGLTESRIRLYVFGMDVQELSERFRKNKTYKEVHVEKSRVNMVDDFYEEAKKKEESVKAEEEQIKAHIETDYEEPKENVPEKKKKTFSFERISSIITFIRDSENKEGFRKIKKELMALLRYAMPYYVRGRVVFGTGDPCTTGWLLGIISVFPAAYTEGLFLLPDFEEKVFEANAVIRGKVRVLYFIRLFLRGYRDESIKNVIKRAFSSI